METTSEEFVPGPGLLGPHPDPLPVPIAEEPEDES